MKPVTVAEWVAALRSPGWHRAEGALRVAYRQDGGTVCHCAVGILCELGDAQWDIADETPTMTVYELPALPAGDAPDWALAAAGGPVPEATATDSDPQLRHLVELGEAGRFLATHHDDIGPFVESVVKAHDEGRPFPWIADLIEREYREWKRCDR